MRLRLYSLLAGISLLLMSACSTEADFSQDPYTNYDKLWEIVDRNYCYFDLKLPRDTTWRMLYDKHRRDLRPGMSTDSLFLVMTELLSELRDGHVNLSSVFDFGRYWHWRDNSKQTYSYDLTDRYLGENYHIAGLLSYKGLDYPEGRDQSIPVAYIRVASFNGALSHSNVTAALNRLKSFDGLILDIRNNGGGQVTASDLLSRHFMQSRRLAGYISHKRGPGHQDFSAKREMWIEPLTSGTIWLKPVVVLVNSGVYSAANDFALRMKGLPHVRLIGQRTGGGGGLPISAELPNGWGVRLSSTRTYDAKGADVEMGIDPDILLEALPEEIRLTSLGEDPYIEYAAKYLQQWISDLRRQNTREPK